MYVNFIKSLYAISVWLNDDVGLPRKWIFSLVAFDDEKASDFRPFRIHPALS